MGAVCIGSVQTFVARNARPGEHDITKENSPSMKIFISYRRADSTYLIGRIRDRLIIAFGPQTVFRDLDDIPAGADFIDCSLFSSYIPMWPNGDHVVISCVPNGTVKIDRVENIDLPSNLEAGYQYASGFNVQVFQDGAPLSVMPENGSIQAGRRPPPTSTAPMYWWCRNKNARIRRQNPWISTHRRQRIIPNQCYCKGYSRMGVQQCYRSDHDGAKRSWADLPD